MSKRTYLYYLRMKLRKLWFKQYLIVYNTKDKSPLEFLTDNIKTNNGEQYEWPIMSNHK